MISDKQSQPHHLVQEFGSEPNTVLDGDDGNAALLPPVFGIEVFAFLSPHFIIALSDDFRPALGQIAVDDRLAVMRGLIYIVKVNSLNLREGETF
jgi:hypothetical protein